MNNKFRLDKNAQPEKYEIFIEPDLENEKFTGNESIHLSINKPTKQIKLNSIGLKINNVKLIDFWGSDLFNDSHFDDCDHLECSGDGVKIVTTKIKDLSD